MLKREKNKPIVFSSHKEFHKAAATGMIIGKRYAVYTKLDGGGGFFCEEGEHSFVYDTVVRNVIDSFTGQKAKDLYDARGQYACFVVKMCWNGKIELVDFYKGACREE